MRASGNSGALIAQTNAVLDTIAARVSELDAGDGISSDGLGWFAHRFGGGARNYTYEYINSKGSFCTGRGPKGKLNTFECFFEPTCAARRDAAASGAPPPAWPLWARALPQLDWMAAVAAFALAHSWCCMRQLCARGQLCAPGQRYNLSDSDSQPRRW